MLSHNCVTWFILVIGISVFWVDSLAVPSIEAQNMTSPNNMTSLLSNMTSQENITVAECEPVVEEWPDQLQDHLAEIKNQTEQHFTDLKVELAEVLKQVLTNLTESVSQVYSDNDQIMEKLNALEESIDEVKAEKKEAEDTIKAVFTEELSCDYVRENVSAAMSPRSGLYWLRDKYGRRYVTYCDFDDAGRSWTLVASVHENKMGVDGRCSAGDKWSSDLGKDGKADDDTAWSDESTFGDVTSAGSADYKSAGYYSIKARNIMIWHVKEHTSVHDFKDKAYLRYRTTNGILNTYGGNLYNLFTRHFAHKPGNKWGVNGPSAPVVYDKGSWASHSYHLGNQVKSRINGGRIQFRAVNYYKDSFALCPGGSLYTASADYYIPEKFCLGSTKRPKNQNACGDFANWDASGYGTGVDNSADQLLVKTTFLIFYG